MPVGGRYVGTKRRVLVHRETPSIHKIGDFTEFPPGTWARTGRLGRIARRRTVAPVEAQAVVNALLDQRIELLQAKQLNYPL